MCVFCLSFVFVFLCLFFVFFFFCVFCFLSFVFVLVLRISQCFLLHSLPLFHFLLTQKAIFLRLDLNDGEPPKPPVFRYFEDLCTVLVESLHLRSCDALIGVLLDNKDVFPPKLCSIACMNRMKENNFPDVELLRVSINEVIDRESQRRRGTIDLNDIISVFELHPEKYLEVKCVVVVCCFCVLLLCVVVVCCCCVLLLCVVVVCCCCVLFLCVVVVCCCCVLLLCVVVVCCFCVLFLCVVFVCCCCVLLLCVVFVCCCCVLFCVLFLCVVFVCCFCVLFWYVVLVCCFVCYFVCCFCVSFCGGDLGYDSEMAMRKGDSEGIWI
jgi:hypothetical protein